MRRHERPCGASCRFWSFLRSSSWPRRPAAGALSVTRRCHIRCCPPAAVPVPAATAPSTVMPANAGIYVANPAALLLRRQPLYPSPLARGNPGGLDVDEDADVSIPARAGQSLSARVRAAWTRAYPRSRGATAAWVLAMLAAQGLSPLTRGNRQGPPRRAAARGPIPAHAGQPGSPCRGAAGRWACPRSRGATAGSCSCLLDLEGLSPLTRGNRRSRGGLGHHAGPIPAHAGQPVTPVV